MVLSIVISLNLFKSSDKCHSSLSVSYTHLDVYKRQVIDIISREDEFNGEKYIALGELLCLQGFVCQSTGDEEGQIKYYLKSIDALNEAFMEDSDIEKRYFQDGIHISDLLSVYDLTINENKKIFKFYEIVGKYDKAEDILFYMIKKSNKEDVYKRQI